MFMLPIVSLILILIFLTKEILIELHILQIYKFGIEIFLTSPTKIITW